MTQDRELERVKDYAKGDGYLVHEIGMRLTDFGRTCRFEHTSEMVWRESENVGKVQGAFV